MEEKLPLHQLQANGRATVEGLTLCGAMARRAGDLGLMEGTSITCVHQSPSGDPRAYLIRGAVIALRNEDASQISVRRDVSWEP